VLVKAVDELGRLGGEVGDERREWVKKIVVSQSVMREVVKTNNVLVKVMGGALISKPDGLESA
jgi:hypothetical protein